jgi:hypothetical protein
VDGDGAGRFGDRAARMACDPMEEELLAQLEDLAQKADVLTHWADEMYEFVKAVPISELFSGTLSPAGLTSGPQNRYPILTNSRSVRMRLTSKPISGRTPIYKRNTTLCPAWHFTCS